MRITYEACRKVRLSHVEGSVEPYDGYVLPSIISEPIRANVNGHISGYSSGQRSVLLKADGRWYKSKGIKPTPLPFLWHKVPYGSMKLEHAINELESNAKLDRRLREYGFSNGPLIPAGRIDYEVPFEDGKCHGAMMECFGDSRLVTLFEALERKMDEGKSPSFSTDFIEGLYSDICSWAGFMHRVLKETQLLYPNGNNDCQNYVFFAMDSGFGLGLVDHDGTKETTDAEKMKLSLERTKQQLVYTLLEVSDSTNTGIDLRELSEYKALESRLTKAYYDGFDGATIPSPIGKDVMRGLFERPKEAPLPHKA